MKPHPPRPWFYCAIPLVRLAGFALGLVLGPLFAVTTTPLTGAIQGRVFNPGSGEFVRNAQVKIQGSDTTTVSEEAASTA